MKLKKYLTWAVVWLVAFHSLSCEEFVEIEAPNNKLIREEVFSSDETALSAMRGIYNELFVAAFSNGDRSSVSFLAALSADNLENLSTTNLPRMEFQQNEISPDNQHNLELWSSAYNMIYLANSFLEGLAGSNTISPDYELQLEGQARFIRAFTYFYLVNLYGDVPLILTSDYNVNDLASRNSKSRVYEQIINDLQIATDLLSQDYLNGERTQVNRYVATALLSRVYLYLENWEMAESLSSEVIGETSTYEVLEDLNGVFLANSREAIWQISPIGDGEMTTHTNDGRLLIIDPVLWFFAVTEITNGLKTSFEDNDKRSTEWIGYSESLDAYYPSKYQVRNSSDFPIEEYSMVFRLTELYLIRSEARVRQGKISEAIEDLDVIRKRAGIELLSETDPAIDQEALLNSIMEERRKELFTEWGHRWLDLKRTDRAGEVLGTDNPLWESTDVLYPIPAEERMSNPNLSQNPGY